MEKVTYIHRAIENNILENLIPNKVIVLLGARRVGKTELLNFILSKVEGRVLKLNGEDQDTQELLENRTIRNYERLLNNIDLLIIDEAQVISEIGLKLKLIVDNIKGIKIIVTGSSVFDLDNQLGEPLVGRSFTYNLYPLAQMEFQNTESYPETLAKFEDRLIFGSYPELEHLETNTKKIKYLKEQINSYLLKDILIFEGLKKRNKITDLLRMLAFRVGSEISMESIGNELGMSKNTVDRYLDLLSKVFIIYNLRGFSRNLDNEITKKSKWYFYDNGIRNALINNFNPLKLRDDHGQLWENYLINERLKHQSYTEMFSANFFWRTHNQQEIDWLEDRNGNLHSYEFKWNSKKKAKAPSSWERAYPNATFEVINPDNYLDFIT